MMQEGRRDQRRAVPRRALRDVAVPCFAYVRVHVHPIRYPAAYTTDWRVRGAELLPDAMLHACIPCSARRGQLTAVPGQARIVSQGVGWVVVDKPAGVPVVHSTDNVIESCLTCVAQARARMPALPDDNRSVN